MKKSREKIKGKEEIRREKTKRREKKILNMDNKK